MKNFAKQLLEARNHRGMTQQEASDLLGVSRRYYIELEKGRSEAGEALMAGMLQMLRQTPTKGKEMAPVGTITP